MIYIDFQGLKLSALGMGCMRLPTCENDSKKIDRVATASMIAYAFDKGINYFDTAWGYHGGNSESVMGEILRSYPRDSFYLASKFPGYDLNNMDKVEEIFEKQLEKCRVEYFDFYLFHNVCELNIDAYLDKKYGIFDYLMKQKKNGRIKHLGFSAHGNLETVTRFLDAYGEAMEFGQIQLNWVDWDFQSAAEKVKLLNSRNIPIWVMEPVRGGSLAKLLPEYEAKLKAMRPDASTVSWAFRFLQSVPGVTVTLSGMSNFEQLKENIEIYNTYEPLTEGEMQMLLGIGKEMTSKDKLPCTSCRYCTSHCPQKLDIPRIIEIYNEYVYTGGGFIAPMALNALSDAEKPSACLSCRACEAVCPQSIKISEMMSKLSRK